MKLKSILFTIVSVMTFVSCTKSDLRSFKETDIVVLANVIQTRAGYEGTSVLPDTFIMDIVQNADPKYDYKSVVMAKGIDNVYAPKSEMKMLWAGNPYSYVNVKAMTIPFGMTDVSAEGSMVIGVNPDQSTAEYVKESDQLYATSDDVYISDGKISIDFKHLFSKLDIRYVYGNGLSASDVTFNSIKLEGVCLKGGYRYSSMSFDDDIEKVYGDVLMYHDDSADTFESVFFPYHPSENPSLKINATVQGEERNLSCKIVPKGNDGFENGKRYKMTVTLNNSSITTGAISIEAAWEIDTDVDLGAEDNTFVTE